MRVRALLTAFLLVASAIAADVPKKAAASQAPATNIQLDLNADSVGPHQMEELTRLAITRDYAEAWDALAQALEQNDTALLNRDFIGFARDNFAARIAEQQKAGVRTKTIDHGHKASAVFYSPDGAGIELRDEAQLEIQILDGDTLVSSTKVTRHYVVLLTPTEVRWKVRILQTVAE